MSSKITIPKICIQCNNGFIAKTTVTKFCSKKCSGKSYKHIKKNEKVKKAQDQEYLKSVGIDMELIQSKEFLSIKETCLLLGISRMSLYRYIKNKTITPSKLGGKVIIKKEVINYLIK
ncbi:MAG: helix-turn-helix domain-containing protein [Bacteroidetes bacterium]|nr:helix-turn-helix domain-containing protein [Bacteroidota bacterium]MDA0980264.1 helix-turn-helix domain-containing protein [Bacteroidota bacterium]